jgi:hypothetical protein
MLFNLSLIEILRTARMTSWTIAFHAAKELFAPWTSVNIGKVHRTECTRSIVFGQCINFTHPKIIKLKIFQQNRKIAKSKKRIPTRTKITCQIKTRSVNSPKMCYPRSNVISSFNSNISGDTIKFKNAYNSRACNDRSNRIALLTDRIVNFIQL